ncbi:phosphogluconate dehydratase [Sneathiella aquimaris]|uniref:phosphogluconate dehydratase n=1 Tax=Sneathiella aquimaris TaxID=2599305 RepID=UPI00146F2196|nr:phosphogluconate dehydratase [Sneathiella aquimaris]
MPIPQIQRVTDRIIARSQESRRAYLDAIRTAKDQGPHRTSLSCGNLAHACAASPDQEKSEYQEQAMVNIGIITAYNDMLSAHQPFESYPALIKEAAREAGGMAQVASGVPAMCDGVTQGQDGMELSLFSRDVIAMATAIGLSHNVFDAALCLGVCDKIVPGLLIGALSFGHLPVLFVPAGPMPSGLPNKEKARIRQEFAAGKIGRKELFEAESASYHSAGTCTFYGTANTNQMLMELMGLHLPGAAFVNPGTELREALTQEAARTACKLAHNSDVVPLGEQIDEKTITNAIVGLLATGGSTNLTIHLIAIAKAAGIQISWQDFSDLSEVVPFITRIYPNSQADVNHFHAAGGFAYLVSTLLENGYLHEDVNTVAGRGLRRYAQEPFLEGHALKWRAGAQQSLDPDILRPADNPFSPTGGLKLLDGNIGRSVIKYSAVDEAHHIVEAPAVIFNDQNAFLKAFEKGELHRDFVAVLKEQGPKSNGMPELHKLTPALGILQDLGYRVALVTDGRMSGASGKVPAAIHMSPEAKDGGNIARLRDGDLLRLDAKAGSLTVALTDEELAGRDVRLSGTNMSHRGSGREIFAAMRKNVSSAEEGASSLF